MAPETQHRPILDHIVILVSHTTLLALPDKLNGLFTVVVGGQHADGLTSNNLIFFSDGVYIELIAFFDNADPERRSKHRWGQLQEGTIIDWAYTLPHESDFAAVQERVRAAETDFAYSDPVPGGRVKPDGTVLKWAVASSRREGSSRAQPGTLPFWGLDRTPRELRVPYKNNPQTQHPSGAQGVSRVLVSIPEGDYPAIAQVYESIQGGSQQATGERWHFDVPSGSTEAKQLMEVSKSRKLEIKLALRGTEYSPSSVELLPGLVLEIDI